MENGEESYRRFLNGDESGFEDVVKLYRSSLELFINRYVNNIYVAQDLAVDTFVYLITHSKKYNFSTPLKTYLFMIGRCRALDYIRHKNRIRVESVEAFGEEKENMLSDTENLENRYIASEQRKTLYKALKKLPQDMQVAVWLVFFEELSYESAAKVMKKNKKQVDNLLYRAKKELKDILKKEGIDSYDA